MQSTPSMPPAHRHPRSGALAIGCLLVALAASPSPLSAQSAGTPTQVRFATSPFQLYQLALEAQSDRDFPEMLRLLRLAAAGEVVQAQETLGYVLSSGTALYGSDVSADLCEARDWLIRASTQGSDVALFLINQLNRVMQARPNLRCSVTSS